jgi:hypothetical protein
MKLWRTDQEWFKYANCGDSPDHTIPPERKRSADPMDDESHLAVADQDKVKSLCGSCRVRPECIQWATDPAKPERSVWCAGRWIPDNKRRARKVRAELVLTLQKELSSRGEDV